MTAFEWANGAEGITPPDEVYCATRDVGQARIEKMRIALEREGWSIPHAALLTSIAGELVSNCFDHNLGTWRDIPGCWFEYRIAGKTPHAFIADRGQGVLGSLRHVRPALADHREALILAFTAKLSGRAPEKRGNGLKFVLRSLNQLPGSQFTFQSGDATLKCGAPIDINVLDRYCAQSEIAVGGTYAEIALASAL